MPAGLLQFLLRWILTTLAVLIAGLLITEIHHDNRRSLLAATLLLSLLNAFLRPLLVMATIGLLGVLNLVLGVRVVLRTLLLQLLLLGFLLLAINAVLLLMVSGLVKGFHVDGFRAAFWGGLIIGAVTLALNSLTRTGNARVVFHRGPPRPPGGGDGPVIDV